MTSLSIEERQFDVVVYGATGYTGKCVAKHIKNDHPSIKMAISGRNQEKLQSLAKDLGLSEDSVLVAPLDDGKKLEEVLKTARIVLACAGPYRKMGKEVVRAAIAAGTDYLDIAGEPQFYDDIFVEYEDSARSASVLVISASAFDCVPAELSATLVSRELQKRFPKSPVSAIELVHTVDSVQAANATTFHAAVDGFHAAITGELSQSRKKVKESFPIAEPQPARPKDWPKLEIPGTIPIYHEFTDTHIMKFVGADSAAIKSSQRYRILRNPEKYKDTPLPRISVCFGLEKSSAYWTVGYGAIFTTLARFKWGCNLLHSYPETFSGGMFRKEGPTDEELSKGSFKMHSVAYGATKEEFVRATCSGPEPGYVATPKMLVALALTVLRHRGKLPYKGGVMLPGAVFGNCQEAYGLLQENGIVFEVVKEAVVS